MTDYEQEFYDEIEEIAPEAAEHFKKHMEEAIVQAEPKIAKYLTEIQVESGDMLVMTFKPTNDREFKVREELNSRRIHKRRKEKWT